MIRPGELNDNTRTSKLQQIFNAFTTDIEKGVYQKNERLPSINDFSKQYNVARQTIEKAYINLRKEGYISSVKGRGHFVTGKPNVRINVLLLFNELSADAKAIYNSIVSCLGDRAKVDLHIYHFNPLLLEEYIDSSLGNYHNYLILPQWDENRDPKVYTEIIKKVPVSQLLLLNQGQDTADDCSGVTGDYRNELFDTFRSAAYLFEKYQKIILICRPEYNFPAEIRCALKDFCDELDKEMEVVPFAPAIVTDKGCVFVVLTEADLAGVMKGVDHAGYLLGEDAGIVSYHDSPLKELMNITVITADFEEMGNHISRMVLENSSEILRTPFKLLIRNSL
jgi:DNA-binding transcriptional regulator YhcF (GntR family)